MTEPVSLTSKTAWVDIHATSGPKSLTEASNMMAVTAISAFRQSGATCSAIIRTRGEQCLQLRDETPVPIANGAQQIINRDRIISDNTAIRKNNREIQEESSQCAGWVLNQLNEASRTAVMNHADWSREANADNNGCLRDGRIDLQRFIRLIWRVKAGQQDEGMEQLQTKTAFDSLKRTPKVDLDAFAADYGQKLNEAIRAGNVIDDSSIYRVSHFVKCAAIDTNVYRDFVNQHGPAMPAGLGHEDVMRFIRRRRSHEALIADVTQNKNAKLNTTNDSQVESAHVSDTTNLSLRGCLICAGFRAIAPERFSERRVASHNAKTCSIGIEALKPMYNELVAPPTSRWDASGNDRGPANKRQRHGGGGRGRDRAATALLAANPDQK